MKIVEFDHVYKQSFKWNGLTIRIDSSVQKRFGQHIFNYVIELDENSPKGCLIQWELVDWIKGNPAILELKPGEKYEMKHITSENSVSIAGVEAKIFIFDKIFYKNGRSEWEAQDITIDRYNQDRGLIGVGSWSATQFKTFGPVPDSTPMLKKRR